MRASSLLFGSGRSAQFLETLERPFLNPVEQRDDKGRRKLHTLLVVAVVLVALAGHQCSCLRLPTLNETDRSMQRERTIRSPDTTTAQDAVLLAWMLIFGVVGILYFLAYNRLHIRADQLVEITIYLLLVGHLRVGTAALEGDKTGPRWRRHGRGRFRLCHARRKTQCLREASNEQLGPARLRHLWRAVLLERMKHAPCSRMPSA